MPEWASVTVTLSDDTTRVLKCSKGVRDILLRTYIQIEQYKDEIERLRARLAAIAALENGLFDPPIRPFVDVLGDALAIARGEEGEQ